MESATGDAFEENEREPLKHDKDNAPKAVVKLSNPRWDPEQGKLGGVVTALVDAEIPEAKSEVTRIEFTLFEVGRNDKPRTLHRDSSHASNGKAEHAFALPEPVAGSDPAAKRSFFFTAKHLYSEQVQSPALEAIPTDTTAADGRVVYYSPLHDEYLVFESQEEFQSLVDEVKALEKLQGRSRRALEISDPEKRQEELSGIGKEVEKLFEGKEIGKSQMGMDGAFEELLEVKRNPRWGKITNSWVYIRGYQRNNGVVKGHRRKSTDITLKKDLEKMLKEEHKHKDEKSPFFDREIKLKIFETDPYEAQWPWKWRRKFDNQEESKKSGKEPEGFRYTAEAAVCRFAAGFDGLELGVSLRDMKVRLGASGHLSYSIFEGQVKGDFGWPEKGVNMLEYLKSIKGVDQFIKQGRECRLRLGFECNAGAFAGLTIKGALVFPDIDFSNESIKRNGNGASVGGEGTALAGGQVRGGLEIAAEWLNGMKFKKLALVGGEAEATAGAAADAKWMWEITDKHIKFTSGVGLAFGIGCGGSFFFEASIAEAWEFIGYLLHSVDFHRIEEIEEKAFHAYKDFTFILVTKGAAAAQDMKDWTNEMIGDFSNAIQTAKDKMEDVKKNLRDSSWQQALLAKVPPEALGAALVTVMKSREPDDFRSMMGILYSTVRKGANPKVDPSANHKLKWTLRVVSGLQMTEFDKEPKKEEALRLGIRRIEDFGAGNFIFLDEFWRLLEGNGLK